MSRRGASAIAAALPSPSACWATASASSAPAGGFFLWLDVGDGEAAAKRLWAEAGLRVLPGAYMARPDAEGRNPGTPYIRVALVHEPEVVEEGLTRLVKVLAPRESDAAGRHGGGAHDRPDHHRLRAGGDPRLPAPALRGGRRHSPLRPGGRLSGGAADGEPQRSLLQSRDRRAGAESPGRARRLYRRPQPAEPGAGELHAGGGAGRLGGEADPPPPRQPLVAAAAPPAGLAAGGLHRPRARPLVGRLALHRQPGRGAGPASLRRRHADGAPAHGAGAGLGAAARLPDPGVAALLLRAGRLLAALPPGRQGHRRGQRRGLDPHQRHHPVASPPARRGGGRAARRAL